MGNVRKKIKEYSTKELRAICQSSAQNPARESKIGRSSRFFSIYFTRLFLYTGLTSHNITVLSVLIFFIGMSFFILPTFLAHIVGLVFVYLSIIIDCCDGEVARFRKKSGVLGSIYTEPVSHDIQYGLMLLPVGIGVFLVTNNPVYIILGAVAGIAKLLYRGLEIRFWMLVHDRKSDEDIAEMKAQYDKKAVLVRLVYWINKNLFSSTGTFLGLLIFTIFNRIDLSMWFYGIGFSILWILIFAKQIYTIDRDRIV